MFLLPSGEFNESQRKEKIKTVAGLIEFLRNEKNKTINDKRKEELDMIQASTKEKNLPVLQSSQAVTCTQQDYEKLIEKQQNLQAKINAIDLNKEKDIYRAINGQRFYKE